MIVFCIGGRPNIVKLYPFIEHFKKINYKYYKIIFTEQHYSTSMSQVFFDEFGFQPDYRLDRAGKGHATQTGSILIELDNLFYNNAVLGYGTDLFVVFGDMNSSLAGALFAQKRNFPIAHIEAGLRVGRYDIPEEINRKLIDHMSTYNFVTEESGITKLENEGLDNGYLVGNVLSDAIRLKDITSYKPFNAPPYCLATFHRPENVDKHFRKIVEFLNSITNKIQVKLLVHPRIKKVFMANKSFLSSNISCESPLNYSDFLLALINASFVITDSGGVQCESYLYRKPCITYNQHTPHKTTMFQNGGTNFITQDTGVIKNLVDTFLLDGASIKQLHHLWDGHATERIITILEKYM